jgi:hypothetical protein
MIHLPAIRRTAIVQVLAVLLLTWVTVSCRSGQSDDAARQFVSQFLSAAQSAAQLPQAEADSLLRRFLHASSFAALGAKPTDYRVNYFQFTDFEVMPAEGELVQVLIWHSQYHWQRNLTFQLGRVGREYRLVPGNMSPLTESPQFRYVDPWIFASPIQER